MKTIEELQAQLKQICAELDALKAAQSPETPETNFKEIAAKASRYPITGHPLANEDEHTKEMYMLMLMSVIVLDSEKYTESFMTFYRIAAGMGYSGNAEELLLKAQTMKFETLDECTRLFGKDDKRLMLLLECMLIAAQFDNGKRKAMEYIAELASLMNVTKEQITFLSNLARVVLTQDLKEYKTDILNTYGELFDCYINNFEDKFQISYITVPITKTVQGHHYSVISFTGRRGILDYLKIENCCLTASYAPEYERNPIKERSPDDFNKILLSENEIAFCYFETISGMRIIMPAIYVFVIHEKQVYIIKAKEEEKIVVGVSSHHPLAGSTAKRKFRKYCENHYNIVNQYLREHDDFEFKQLLRILEEKKMISPLDPETRELIKD